VEIGHLTDLVAVATAGVKVAVATAGVKPPGRGTS
jgi:membrane protein required for colicin V production